MLQSWNKAFGGDLVQPESEISDELRAHLRYPEDLFKVQRELLTRYHVTDAAEFFSPRGLLGGPGRPGRRPQRRQHRARSPTRRQQPAPGSDVVDAVGRTARRSRRSTRCCSSRGRRRGSFRLSTSFTGLNRPNLAAFASVSSDPEDYGQIRVLQFPRQDPPNGPGQVANQFVSEQVVAESLFPFRQNRAEVTFGNLLTLPAGQRTALRAAGLRPGRRAVRASRRCSGCWSATATRWRPTPRLARSLADLFGAPRRPPTRHPTARGTSATPTPSGTATPSPPDGAAAAGDVAALVAEATDAFEAGQAALRANDFAAYGQAQERLRVALDRLAAAEGAAAHRPTPAADAGLPARSPSMRPPARTRAGCARMIGRRPDRSVGTGTRRRQPVRWPRRSIRRSWASR